MYHGPKMCRTCLQMSRGDFKFVRLDSVDPLWESSSPNLKAQLMSLVPEMKIDESNTYICTSCFIALRTAYEFKKMCQATEQRFQTHNYRYRRPFGVGPGSPQFHVTLNENRGLPLPNPANNAYRSQKLNYLQADTSIDITEHHLYDASRNVPRRLQYINNGSQKIPEFEVVVKPQVINVSKKTLNSEELKEKFNLGSQISIVKPEKPKNLAKNDDMSLIKLACEEIPYLKENNLSPNALQCEVKIQVLTQQFVKVNTAGKYSLNDIKSISHSYYFERLAVTITCQFCPKTFVTRFLFQMHQYEDHADKIAKLEVKKELNEAPKHETVNDLNSAVNDEPKDELKDKPEGEPKDEQKDELKENVEPSTSIPCKKLLKVKKRIFKYKLNKYKRCCICSKAFVSRLHLLNHCKYLHVPKCGIKQKLRKKIEKIKTDTLPKLRMRTRHSYAMPFNCNICDKGFSDENELDVHMYVHTPVVVSNEAVDFPKEEETECLFTCYLCGKSFLKERFLKLHNVQMHLRNKPTTCKNCGRVFKSEFWYERHKCAIPPEEMAASQEILDDGNMFPCNFCDRKFSKMRFMKIHSRRAHKTLMMRKEPKDLSADDTTLDSTVDGTDGGPESENDGRTSTEAHLNPVTSEYAKTEGVLSTTQTQLTSTTVPIEVKFEIKPPLRDPTEPPARRGRPPLVKEIKPLLEMQEPDLGVGRGRNRGLPKIQCDFCGELIEENRYDKHIAEHNKSRLQRRVSTNATHIEEYDSDDFPLKCPVCYKGFKRKYYYDTHINKHIEEGVDVQEAPLSPMIDHSASPSLQTDAEADAETEDSRAASDDDGDESYVSERESPILEEDDIQGEEFILEDNSRLYVCCGRSFKLKAHFFRHYKIKHPNNINKRHPIKYAEEPEETETRMETPPVETPPVEAPPVETPTEIKIPESEPEQISVPEPEDSVPLITESNLPSDLEIGLKEEMDLQKVKRKLSDAETENPKRAKTENPEAVKLRNTVAAHLDDIEIVAVSPTPPTLKYECDQCDKRFRQKFQLRDHLNVHSGDKPYKCEFCKPTHGFTQSSSLYFHIRKVHTAVMKNVSWAIQSKNGLCLICLDVFEKHLTMYSHLRENFVESGFDCEICSKNVTMTCHYKVHNIDPNDMDSFMLPQQTLEVLLTEEVEEEKHAADNESCSSSVTSAVDESLDNVNEADIIMRKARRCEPCNKMFKSEQYYNLHIRSLIHRQRVDLLASKSETESAETEKAEIEKAEVENAEIEKAEIEKAETEKAETESEAEKPECEITLNASEQNENAPNEGENADVDTIKEIEDNCKAITKKIHRIGTFKCSECDALFITRTHLRKHKRIQNHTSYAIHKKRLSKLEETLKLEAMETESETIEQMDEGIEQTENQRSESVLDEEINDTSQTEMASEPSTLIPVEIATNTTEEQSIPGTNNEVVEPVSDLPVGDITIPETLTNSPVFAEHLTILPVTDQTNLELLSNVPVIENALAQPSLNIPLSISNELTLVKIPETVQGVSEPPNPLDSPNNVKAEQVQDEEMPLLPETTQTVNTPEAENINSVQTTNSTLPPKHFEPIKSPSPPKRFDPVKSPSPTKRLEPVKSPSPPKRFEPVKSPSLPQRFEPVKLPQGSQISHLTEITVMPQKQYGNTNISRVINSKLETGSTYSATNNPTLSVSPVATFQNMNRQQNIQSLNRSMYSNRRTPDPRHNFYLPPSRFYTGEELIPEPHQQPPMHHYAPIMERRLSQAYPTYPQMEQKPNYYASMKPVAHSTFMQNPRGQQMNSSGYGPFLEQGFVMHDEEMMGKSLTEGEPDANPEQELLALLHTGSNSAYEARKCDNAAYDTEQEFIDLESAGPKILKQSFERLNKSKELGSADSSQPDHHHLLYGRNSASEGNVTQLQVSPTENVDYQGRLPIQHVLNKVTHHFS